MKNCGRIIVYGIDACDILPEEERTAEEEAVENSFAVEDCYERLGEGYAYGTLLFKSCVDGGYFFEHVDIVEWELTYPLEIL